MINYHNNILIVECLPANYIQSKENKFIDFEVNIFSQTIGIYIAIKGCQCPQLIYRYGSMPNIGILTTTANETAKKKHKHTHTHKYLSQISLSHVEVKIPHIQFSVHCSIWSYYSSSTGSIRLNKIFFGLRRFHHYRLPEK